MKTNLVFIILFFFSSSCQTLKLTKFSSVKNDEKYIIEKNISEDKQTILIKFKCDNELKSIVLPNDLIKTFNIYYEEGYYKDFIFADNSYLTILCGCCATITDNKKNNILVDSIKINSKNSLIITENKITGRFTQTNDYIQASNVKKKRQKIFEKLIVDYIKNN